MRIWPSVALACMLMQAGATHAADAPPGAASCSGCHAVSRNVDTAVPGIAGRKSADLSAAMREFKSGARPATVMGRIARGFSDTEIEAIAVWFSTQPQ
jgi:sulfide dehydrogenase cytochrome subunit